MPEKELEVVQTRTSKIVRGCSQRTSNAAVSVELGIHSLRTGETYEG